MTPEQAEVVVRGIDILASHALFIYLILCIMLALLGLIVAFLIFILISNVWGVKS